MNYQVIPKAKIGISRTPARRSNFSYRFPSVSVFMPFNPKMVEKKQITFSLAKAIDEVVMELRDKYPGDMSLLVIQKLKAIIRNLDFNTHKKSIAIFVSPVFEKVYYLNTDVEEKIIVDEYLQIRNLLSSRKKLQPFHILLLTEKGSRIFINDTSSYINISAEAFSDNANKKELLRQPVNSSGLGVWNGFLTGNFLGGTDHSLSSVLQHNHLSVVVMGSANLVQKFKSITQNNEAIIQYFTGDFEECSLSDLRGILKSQQVRWQKIKQKDLLRRLHHASDKKALSYGFDDVQSAVLNHKGKLLMIEKKLLDTTSSFCDTGAWQDNRLNDKRIAHYNKFSNIKNRVDEIIEKVLENGGDVELVSEGFLKEYSQIALIKN